MSQAAEAAESARILVVDDERVIREILAEFLALEGFSVHTVEDGEKALEAELVEPFLVIDELAFDHPDLRCRPTPGQKAELQEAHEDRP